MADEQLAEAEFFDELVSEEERELLEFMLGTRVDGRTDLGEADPQFRERLRQKLLRELRGQRRGARAKRTR